jgi:GDPmannose 4,6-dehydratase
MSKRALITGVTGFVGPCLAKQLIDLDYEVYGIVRRRAESKKPWRLVEKGIFDEVKIIDGDLTDLTSILSTLDKSQPDVIFHLAAQSYVPRSFINPVETFKNNSFATENLLEAIRLKDLNSKIVFACSSETYGLQFSSHKQYERALEKYGAIFPEPRKIPELPIDEDNLLRPMSPYAVTKAYGDLLMRNYHRVYGLKTVVSRAFNHEGAGRGHHFVTSTVVRECLSLKFGELDCINLGNISTFRDWSHVDDIVNGYILLSEKGKDGDVYVQGAQRTTSVLSYLLMTLQYLGYQINEIETLNGEKRVKEPTTHSDSSEFFGLKFDMTKIDELLLNGELDYVLSDRGLTIRTDKGKILLKFDPEKFREAEVPILLSKTSKIRDIGFKSKKSIKEIIADQVNYYLDTERRNSVSVN